MNGGHSTVTSSPWCIFLLLAVVTSDASGNWGYAETSWFMLPWAGSVANSHITMKEMVPIVIVGAPWGHIWRCNVTIIMAVINIVNHGSSKNQEAMHLARFLACKSDFHIVATHIKGVHNIIIAEGFGNPHINNMARPEQVLKGIKALQSKGPKRVTRLPIIPDHLVKLKEVWSRGKYCDGLMSWAAALLCFTRSGELTVPTATSYDEGAHLIFNDVAVNGMDQGLEDRPIQSRGEHLRWHNFYAPSWLSYITWLQEGRVVAPSSGLKVEAPSPAQYMSRLKEALSRARVDCTAYSGHNFRSRVATTAAKQGASDATIKMLGRWKSSAYIKTPREQLATYSLHIGTIIHKGGGAGIPGMHKVVKVLHGSSVSRTIHLFPTLLVPATFKLSCLECRTCLH